MDAKATAGSRRGRHGPTAGLRAWAVIGLVLPAVWGCEREAERVYALLTQGGEVFMKMEQTPFANRLAMLRDRFGTSWMLLHQPRQRGEQPGRGLGGAGRADLISSGRNATGR